MANQYFNRNGRIAQDNWRLVEAVKARSRCEARMSAEAFQAARDQLFELLGYPTPEQRHDYWLEVEANLKPHRCLYDLAREKVAENQSWKAGESLDIGSHGTWTIYLRNATFKTLALGLRNGERQLDEITVARLDLASGAFWRWTLERDDYESWAQVAREEVKNERRR